MVDVTWSECDEPFGVRLSWSVRYDSRLVGVAICPHAIFPNKTDSFWFVQPVKYWVEPNESHNTWCMKPWKMDDWKTKSWWNVIRNKYYWFSFNKYLFKNLPPFVFNYLPSTLDLGEKLCKETYRSELFKNYYTETYVQQLIKRLLDFELTPVFARDKQLRAEAATMLKTLTRDDDWSITQSQQ